MDKKKVRDHYLCLILNSTGVYGLRMAYTPHLPKFISTIFLLFFKLILRVVLFPYIVTTLKNLVKASFRVSYAIEIPLLVKLLDI